MQFEAGHIRGGERSAAASPLDRFDPRCRVFCALAFSAVLASVQSLPALFAGSLVPFLLLFAGNGKELAQVLARINVVTVFMWLLLPLLTPGLRLWGLFSIPGLHLALLVTCKLNLISVIWVRMAADLGMGKIDGVLSDFRLPEKLRVLFLLTLRCTFLLTDRVAAMTRAIRLRASGLRGRKLWPAFACMLGTTLIHSSDRAERSMLAMRCRGGIGGFSQRLPMKWSPRDTLLFLFFALNAALTLAFSY